jgi:predicted nucleic acid-binding Zn finger protein
VLAVVGVAQHGLLMNAQERLLDEVLAKGFPLSEQSMELLTQLFSPQVVAIGLEAGLSKGVICVTATPSGRTAHEFSYCGTRTSLSLLSPGRLFCSCDVFAERLCVGESVICKHLLAAKIAVAGKALVVESVKDAEFSNRVLQSALQ